MSQKIKLDNWIGIATVLAAVALWAADHFVIEGEQKEATRTHTQQIEKLETKEDANYDKLNTKLDSLDEKMSDGFSALSAKQAATEATVNAEQQRQRHGASFLVETNRDN